MPSVPEDDTIAPAKPWSYLAAFISGIIISPTVATDAIADADALLCTYSGKLPYDVLKEDKKDFTDLLGILDAYNNDEFTPECQEE